MSDRKSVTLEDGQAAVIEDLSRESKQTSDVPPISQAEAIRYLVDTGIETIIDDRDVEGVDGHTAEVLREMIPSHAVVDWKRDQIKSEAREVDLRGRERARDAPEAYWSILGDAVDTWGEGVQMDIALEELGELVTALSRLRRHRVTEADVTEEIADVQIMLDQLQIIFDEPDVDAEVERKIDRLRERLQEEG